MSIATNASTSSFPLVVNVLVLRDLLRLALPSGTTLLTHASGAMRPIHGVVGLRATAPAFPALRPSGTAPVAACTRCDASDPWGGRATCDCACLTRATSRRSCGDVGSRD